MRAIAKLAIMVLTASALLLTACDQPSPPTATTPPTAALTPSRATTTHNPPTHQSTMVLIPTIPVQTPTLPPSPAPPLPNPTTAPTPTPDIITNAVSPTETPPPDAFVSTLSVTETECFPTAVESDQQLTRFMDAATNSFVNPYFDCLTDANRFHLYLQNVKTDPSDHEFLSTDTHRCIWDGLQPVFKLKPETDAELDEHTASTLMAATFLAPIAVMAYCVSDADLERLGDAAPTIETTYMRCVVDQQGGPRQFIQMLVDNPNTFEAQLAAAELHCDQVVYEATPGSRPGDAPTKKPSTHHTGVPPQR